MRKPLVVVCAASAMLLAGVFVATSAGAEETPDLPGWSMLDLASLFGDEDGLALSDADAGVPSAKIADHPVVPEQQRVLALVNQSRRRGGCAGLSLDRRLTDAATGHAADMARRHYFAHESPNGEGIGDRVSDAGYHWKRYGENLARGVDSADAVVDGWLHRPEHRANILDCGLHQMGVGLAVAGDHTRYWVQDFATPSRPGA